MRYLMVFLCFVCLVGCGDKIYNVTQIVSDVNTCDSAVVGVWQLVSTKDTSIYNIGSDGNYTFTCTGQTTQNGTYYTGCEMIIFKYNGNKRVFDYYVTYSDKVLLRLNGGESIYTKKL